MEGSPVLGSEITEGESCEWRPGEFFLPHRRELRPAGLELFNYLRNIGDDAVVVVLLWRMNMSELVCELIVSLDGFARGQRSPGYFGYSGPDFDDWIKTNSAVPHRILIGRKTYEMLNALPAEARDEGWEIMTTMPGWLFSKTLKAVVPSQRRYNGYKLAF